MHRGDRRTSNGQAGAGPVSGSAKRCAIYTRKSTEEGLDQDFNSLQAQREACEACVASQRHEGWVPILAAYDDGGYSGGGMERPGLQAMLADIDASKIDVVVVYKVDRLTRSLSDFARMVERFDRRSVSFISVTQAFNTTSSMGRLTLNVLLSFGLALSGGAAAWWLGARLGYVTAGVGMLVVGVGVLGWSFAGRSGR